MKRTYLMLLIATVMGCANPMTENSSQYQVKLITLDPGHFHSALVQKSMYPGMDSTVHVYAPEGEELKAHLNLIEQYNNDAENPTRWNEVVYTGNDFFEKML